MHTTAHSSSLECQQEEDQRFYQRHQLKVFTSATCVDCMEHASKSWDSDWEAVCSNAQTPKGLLACGLLDPNLAFSHQCAQLGMPSSAQGESSCCALTQPGTPAANKADERSSKDLHGIPLETHALCHKRASDVDARHTPKQPISPLAPASETPDTDSSNVKPCSPEQLRPTISFLGVLVRYDFVASAHWAATPLPFRTPLAEQRVVLFEPNETGSPCLVVEGFRVWG